MRRLFTKEQILSFPNLLSLVRLLLIPIFIRLYLHDRQYSAVAMLALSGLTDIADGIIARKCGMITDLGKILDPIADKLTQIAVMCCLVLRYRILLVLLAAFLLRELCVTALGYFVLKRLDKVNGANWYGKLSTVTIYAVFLSLLLFPGIPLELVDGMIAVGGGCVLLSLILYSRFYILQLRGSARRKGESTGLSDSACDDNKAVE